MENRGHWAMSELRAVLAMESEIAVANEFTHTRAHTHTHGHRANYVDILAWLTDTIAARLRTLRDPRLHANVAIIHA